jgi:hypothetical protein
MFRNVPQLMFPVLWFDSEADLPDSMASPLNMLVVLQFLIQVSYAAHIGLLAVLTLLITSGLWCLLCFHGRSHVLGVALSRARRGRKMWEKEKARNITRVNKLKYGG